MTKTTIMIEGKPNQQNPLHKMNHKKTKGNLLKISRKYLYQL